MWSTTLYKHYDASGALIGLRRLTLVTVNPSHKLEAGVSKGQLFTRVQCMTLEPHHIKCRILMVFIPAGMYRCITPFCPPTPPVKVPNASFNYSTYPTASHRCHRFTVRASTRTGLFSSIQNLVWIFSLSTDQQWLYLHLKYWC